MTTMAHPATTFADVRHHPVTTAVLLRNVVAAASA